MRKVAFVAALLAVAGCKEPPVPKGFGDGRTMIRSWSQGLNGTWVRVFRLRVLPDRGELAITFTMVNMSAVRKDYKPKDFEVLVSDNLMKFSTFAPGEPGVIPRSLNAGEETEPFTVLIKAPMKAFTSGEKWAVNITLLGEAFGERDFLFTVSSTDPDLDFGAGMTPAKEWPKGKK
jgi:hypothetical protein